MIVSIPEDELPSAHLRSVLADAEEPIETMELSEDDWARLVFEFYGPQIEPSSVESGVGDLLATMFGVRFEVS